MNLRIVLLCVLALGGCAHLPADEPADPLEGINRPIFKFNRTADKYVLRPVAKGYVNWTPVEIRGWVGNFLDNLFYPTTIVNDFLQGKLAQGGKDTGRFLMNSTIGLVGFLDVATRVGLPANDEDLGQTFGSWGFGEGWYLMLPLLGPSNNRDLLGTVGDMFTSPTHYMDSEPSLAINGAAVIDKRAGLLDADRYLDESLDPYVALRTAYLQKRQSKVYDGNPPKEKFDFGE